MVEINVWRAPVHIDCAKLECERIGTEQLSMSDFSAYGCEADVSPVAMKNGEMIAGRSRLKIFARAS
jgi:hypothetical protein